MVAKMKKCFLKWIAPKSFNYGLNKCNELGKKLLSNKHVSRMLDVGCADGKLTLEFAKIINANEIYGIEFVDELREIAESKNIICYKFDLNNKWEIESEKFDLIISSQNIEHMHNTRLYLEECFRCLKPDGQLLILTENLSSWVNIGALLFGWLPFSLTAFNGLNLGNPCIWHIDEYKDKNFRDKYQQTGVSGTVGHIRVLTYRGLKDLLKFVGFKEVRVFSRGYLPLFGKISDFLCALDKIHGHFLIATGYK